MIEDHPDIKRLNRHLEKIWDTRETNEKREMVKRENDINENIPAQIYYCTDCKKDYIRNRSFKVEEVNWNGEAPFRYWKTKHSCGKWCIRYITNKLKDPFWRKSKVMKKEISIHIKCRINRFYRFSKESSIFIYFN